MAKLKVNHPFNLTIINSFLGLFGWSASNYILGKFEIGESCGFIDLGGASSQIAFQVNNTHHNAMSLSLRMMDGTLNHYNVFVATFLGLKELYLDILHTT